MDHPVKHIVDAVSIGTIVSTLAGWLPGAAALASLVWTCIRIYETKTVQSLLERKRNATCCRDTT